MCARKYVSLHHNRDFYRPALRIRVYIFNIIYRHTYIFIRSYKYNFSRFSFARQTLPFLHNTLDSCFHCNIKYGVSIIEKCLRVPYKLPFISHQNIWRWLTWCLSFFSIYVLFSTCLGFWWKRYQRIPCEEWDMVRKSAYIIIHTETLKYPEQSADCRRKCI